MVVRASFGGVFFSVCTNFSSPAVLLAVSLLGGVGTAGFRGDFVECFTDSAYTQHSWPLRVNDLDVSLWRF